MTASKKPSLLWITSLNLTENAARRGNAIRSKGQERENVWSSDRRFGDILANNIEQNRQILDHDEAEHPWARFGGQMAGGLVIPGAAVEDVGLAAARKVIQDSKGPPAGPR